IADEADPAGRTFSALRVSHDFAKQSVGMMYTTVDRPYFDRTANVLGFDQNWRPNERLSIQNRLIFSDIDEGAANSPSVGQTEKGDGFTTIIDYEMDKGWRQQWLAMHFSDDLQINDFGFLSRNNLNYAHWQVMKRFTGMPEFSRFSSPDWRARISGTDNDHGQDLQRQFRLSVSNQLKDGSNSYAQININSAGYDDRLLRGFGIVHTSS